MCTMTLLGKFETIHATGFWDFIVSSTPQLTQNASMSLVVVVHDNLTTFHSTATFALPALVSNFDVEYVSWRPV